MFLATIDFKTGAVLNNLLDLSPGAKAALDFARSVTLTDGTGDNQANQMWFDTRPLAALANDDIDLTGGISNGLNQVITFARLKHIMLFSKVTNTANLRLGTTAGTPPWLSAAASDTVTPGGLIWRLAPGATAYPIVAPADVLRITNLSATDAAEYDIVLIGATA